MNRRGFTLLELLVAVAIFSVLSVVAYSSLNAMVNTREQVVADMERLGQLQIGFTMLERDLQQAVSGRGIRDEYEEVQPAMLLHTVGDLEGGLEFTRGGWSNPAGQARSTLQRVAYQLQDDNLVRYSWRVLDRVVDSEPFSSVVLGGVQEFSISFLDADNKWQDGWPLAESRGKVYLRDQLPRAVKLSMDVKGYGVIERILVLAAEG